MAFNHLHRRTNMGFFEIPTELRCQIYSELLISSDPITFVAALGRLLPPLKRSGSTRVYAAILCVNSKAYHEASPILYSNNCFRFPEVHGSAGYTLTHAHIAPFLTQIGLQAGHICHICIPFPTFNYPIPKSAKLHEAHSENLKLIGITCIKLKTLELLVSPECSNYAFSEHVVAVEALNILNTHMRAIGSIETIMVNFEEHPEHNPSDDLMNTMRRFGWAVEITRLPKRTWISYDDQVEFDNEEDCNAYDNECLRREIEMEEEKEEKMWLEHYSERRRDPYRKNDSDYD